MNMETKTPVYNQAHLPNRIPQSYLPTLALFPVSQKTKGFAYRYQNNIEPLTLPPLFCLSASRSRLQESIPTPRILNHDFHAPRMQTQSFEPNLLLSSCTIQQRNPNRPSPMHASDISLSTNFSRRSFQSVRRMSDSEDESASSSRDYSKGTEEHQSNIRRRRTIIYSPSEATLTPLLRTSVEQQTKVESFDETPLNNCPKSILKKPKYLREESQPSTANPSLSLDSKHSSLLSITRKPSKRVAFVVELECNF